jgi:hypothetical protein
MAITYYPSINLSGLILLSDSANKNSYSGTGSTWYDLSGRGNDGALINGPTFNANTNKGAFTFDGTNDYVNFGNSSVLQQSSGTLSAWAKASSPGAGYRGIIAKQGAYGLFYTNSVLVAYDWAADAPRSTGINIADNTWKNVVLTYQSGVSNGTKIYINGVSVLTTTITIQSQVANLFGGAEANASQYASCQISSLNMYNRVLTEAEVANNYNATKGRYGL